jgi:hypothetical protein
VTAPEGVEAASAPVRYRALCEGCGEYHPAEYHHDGQWGEGPIYAATCPVDGLTDFLTWQGVVVDRTPAPDLRLTITTERTEL